MIPYILAENPKIQRKKAFKLSKEIDERKQMENIYFRSFFLGWELLSGTFNDFRDSF